MKKALIFDLDGTLFYTLIDLMNAVNYSLQKLNYKKRSIEEVRQFLGNGIYSLVYKSLPNNDKEKIDEAYNLFKNYYEDHLNDNTKLYDGIINLLEILKENNIKMAVVSNKFDLGVKKICIPVLSKYMDVFIGEKEGLRKKPEIDMFLLATKKLKLNLNDICYVGDSEVDIKTAKKNNLSIIGCSWGYRDKNIFIENDVLFAEKPLEIFEIFKNMN